MPKNKAKGRRRAGGQARGAEKGEQRQIRAAVARHREYRRTCDVCGLKADACDRPFPTCHCGKRRYCGEACQAEDWAAGHARTCASGYLYLEDSEGS